jgi:ParB family transcriptional regulator, chromosome partitioning protein
VQYALRHDQISMGHARALISIADAGKQLKALLRIVENGLSVREAEKIAKDIQAPVPPKAEKAPALPENIESPVSDLKKRLGTTISVKRNNIGQGSIVIKFASDSELARILEILNKDEH